MLSRQLVPALSIAVSALVLACPAAAQSASPRSAAALIRLGAPAPAPAPPLVLATRLPLLPDSAKSGRNDHTLLGMLIGGALGFAAGWVFYDTLCEAVDNRCSDPRWPDLALGAGLGALLGGLVGSAGGD